MFLIPQNKHGSVMKSNANSLRYQCTYCDLLYTFIDNWLLLLSLTLIFFREVLCMLCFTHTYTQYVWIKKGDRQHLVRSKLKLAKYPTSTTHYVLLLSLNYPQRWWICLASFMSMSRGKPPALIKSLDEAR